MKRRIKALTLSCAVAALGLLALTSTASASFHEIKVRAVFRGPGADDGFIELQMYAPGQTLVGGQILHYYGPTGASAGDFPLPAGTLAHGENQRTLLIGDTNTVVGPPDYTDSNLSDRLIANAAGGAVCWASFDCVSWGNFTGNASLPSSAGTPANGNLTTSRVLGRDIASNCATALDAADDTNDSNADFDFIAGFQTRNNAGAITENTCPETIFVKRAKPKSSNRAPTFKISSSEASSTFQCKLDQEAFLPCLGTETFHVKRGKHALLARAIDPLGAVDPTPAVAKFRVVKPKHKRKHHKHARR